LATPGTSLNNLRILNEITEMNDVEAVKNLTSKYAAMRSEIGKVIIGQIFYCFYIVHFSNFI
jgi:hypothetical protein